MAAVSLFGGPNMAAVTSCENQELIAILLAHTRLVLVLGSKKVFFRRVDSVHVRLSGNVFHKG